MIMIGNGAGSPDGVESDAPGRAERLGVERRRQDVGEAAQRPKSETFVVVDGRLVAQSPPGLVGSNSLVGVVRIPIGPILVTSVMIPRFAGRVCSSYLIGTTRVFPIMSWASVGIA